MHISTEWDRTAQLTHRGFDGHHSTRTVTQVSETSADTCWGCLHVHSVLVVHRRADVVLQVLRCNLNMHGVRDLHRLTLDSGNFARVFLALLLGRRSLGCASFVDRSVHLLDGLLNGLVCRLCRLLGLGLLRLLGRGGGGRLGEDVLAEVFDDLQRGLTVDLYATAA